MKKKLIKPEKKVVKVSAYNFEGCSGSGSFNPCGLKW